MKTQQTMLVASKPLQEQEIIFSIGKNEAMALGIGFLGTFYFVFFFYKKLTYFMTDMKEWMNEKNKNIDRMLSNSQVIPKEHALVPLKEGFSSHALPSGYTMRVERKLEHRAVAEAVIGRPLATNEHVHHVYAPATGDNRPENLCILDKDQHDIFHTYILREKTLKGRYPTTMTQRRILKEHFNGILLDDALLRKKFQFPPIQPVDTKFDEETY
ncbi:MAG: hypothetical protein WCK42_00665 [Myxococcaceae bacterium]